MITLRGPVRRQRRRAGFARIGPALLAILVFAGTLLSASCASAQPPQAGADALLVFLLAMRSVVDQAPTGAFGRLAPDDQKIARALFEAQAANPSASVPGLRLDQIAGRRHRGETWDQVFNAMKAQGLLVDATLGQAVSARGPK
jgi:hypothetical protein